MELLARSPMAGAALFNIRDFGARGDGHEKDTIAIQKAINACTEAGGGVVYCPPGTYVSGTLFLKDNVRLHLEIGATLLGSPDRADYIPIFSGPQWVLQFNYDQYLICARRARNIAITGLGTIDGNGRAFFGPALPGRRVLSIPLWRPGPMITFMECQDVTLQDVRLVDAPAYAVWPHGCERVKIQGVTIINQRTGPNCDGIDPICCKDVRISDCSISTGDDCIAVYGWTHFLAQPRLCEDIVVTNCVLTSPCNGIRVGYTGDGRIRRCTFSNLVMFDSRTGISMVSTPVNPWRLAGEPEPAYGPTVEEISFDHIRMQTRKPIDLWIDDAARPPAGIRNVSISHIDATLERGCYIGGGRRVPIEDVHLDDVRLRVNAAMPAPNGSPVPDPYPVYDWDTPGLPYGLFSRHARGLELRHVEVLWERAGGGWQSAIRVEDAQGLDLVDAVVSQAPSQSTAPAIHLSNVNGARVQSCRAAAGCGTFLGIDGPASAHIALMANDLRQARAACRLSEEVPAQALQQRANILQSSGD
jgi:hypothetical protein